MEKKHKLKRQNFHEAMLKARIPIKAIENLWKGLENGIQNQKEFFINCFLSAEKKLQVCIENKTKQIRIQNNT